MTTLPANRSRFDNDLLEWSGSTASNTQVRLTPSSTGTNATLTLSSTTGVGNDVRIAGVQDPLGLQDAATKNYVDGLVGGALSWKDTVRATTTANIALGLAANPSQIADLVIDGITFVSPGDRGQRILCKNQTNAIENGIYILTAAQTTFSYWARASDLEIGAGATGAALYTSEGTTNSENTYICTTPRGPISAHTDVVGTAALTFVLLSSTFTGAVAAAGANTQVQYNFQGDLEATNTFTFNQTSNTLILGTQSILGKISAADAAAASGLVGGDLTILGGEGDGAGNGGTLTLSGGAPGATGNGGNVSIITQDAIGLGKDGGNMNLTIGSGTTSASAGGDAGIYTFTGGAGGPLTGAGGTAGNGTSTTTTLGSGGATSTGGTGGNGGDYSITGGNGGTAGAGGNSGNGSGFSFVGGSGGAIVGAGLVAGNGSDISFVGGAGGSVPSGGVGSVGGNGAGFSFLGGAGGAGGAASGDGSDISFTAGAGGSTAAAGVVATGGKASNILFTGSSGGNSATGIAGNGTTISFTAGAGGTGGATNGDDGEVILATTGGAAKLSGNKFIVEVVSGDLTNDLTVSGGDGVGAGDGGTLNLIGGVAGATGNAGNVAIASSSAIGPGKNGGNVNMNLGSGTTSTGIAGDAGMYIFTGGVGGPVTGAGGAGVFAGDGSGMSVTLGAGGPTAAAGTGGDGGDYSITGGVGGTAGAGGTGGNGSGFSFTGGDGGGGPTCGNGSGFSFTGGTGGSTILAASNGGDGAGFSFVGGAGGAGVATGGDGLDISFTAGAGGTSSGAAGAGFSGNAANISFVGGAGGAAGAGEAGDGSDFSFTGGDGGSGSTGPGGDGSGFSFVGGNGGAVSGAGTFAGNAANISLVGGNGGAAPTASATNGDGSNIIFTAGAAGVGGGVAGSNGIITLSTSGGSAILSANTFTVGIVETDTVTASGGITSAGTLFGNITTGSISIGDALTTGDITMGGAQEATGIITLGTSDSSVQIPKTDFSLSNPTSVVNKGYVDAVAIGLNWKDAVYITTATILPNTPAYSSAGNGTLTEGTAGTVLSIDGFTVTALGYRVLVKNQVAALQNGIYVLTTAGVAASTPWVLTRVDGMADDGVTTILDISGSAAFSKVGTVNEDTAWVETADTAGLIGVDPMVWAQFAGSGANVAGANTQVQYNDDGVFAGDTAFTFDKATNNLTVGEAGLSGSIISPGGAGATNGVTLTIDSGDGGIGVSDGGLLTLSSGNSGATGATGNGGAIDVTSGNSVATNGNGGDITVTAGNGNGSGTSGVVNINTGGIIYTYEGTIVSSDGAVDIRGLVGSTFDIATTTTTGIISLGAASIGALEIGSSSDTCLVNFNSTLQATAPGTAGVTIDGGLGVAEQIFTSATTGGFYAGASVTDSINLTHDGTDGKLETGTAGGSLNIQVTDTTVGSHMIFTGSDQTLTTTQLNANFGTGNMLEIASQTVTITDAATSATAATITIPEPKYESFIGATTITDAATMYIEEPTSGDANTTITNAWSIWSRGDIRATVFETTSDVQFKENIQPLSEVNPLQKLMEVEGYSYNWKPSFSQNRKKQWGVIAQQLESIEDGELGHLVSGTDQKSVNYLGLIPLMIEAIKELARITCDFE
jgi:hypothetical protein